jgi:WhiB family redox-sensing transcriptional regulator
MSTQVTTEARLARGDALYRLLTHLTASDFGGHPACAEEGVEPEWFFPVSADDRERIALAKTVCRSCPVSTSCLRYALHAPETTGVWGGTTEEQRAAMRTAGQGPADQSVEGWWVA